MTEEEKRYWENWDGEIGKILDDNWKHEKGWYDAVAEDIKILIPEGTIGEIGCGTGHVLDALIRKGRIKKPELEYYGCDVSQVMLDKIKEKYPMIAPEKMDILKLDLGNNAIDNVICISILQHLPNYVGALKELIRVARSKLYIITWYKDGAADNIHFSEPSVVLEGKRFHNNSYSFCTFMFKLILFAEAAGKQIDIIRVFDFHYNGNKSIYVQFAGRRTTDANK